MSATELVRTYRARHASPVDAVRTAVGAMYQDPEL
jgi:hypothetical protein